MAPEGRSILFHDCDLNWAAKSDRSAEKSNSAVQDSTFIFRQPFAPALSGKQLTLVEPHLASQQFF